MVNQQSTGVGSHAGYRTYTGCCFVTSERGIWRLALAFCFKKREETFYAADFLHGEERSYYETLKAGRRINSYLMGRLAAKSALAAYTGFPRLQDFWIKNGIFQQPVAVGPSCGNLDITITHCDALAAAAAFSDELLIGMDIERIDPARIEVFESQLTQAERQLAGQLTCGRDEFAVMLWTAKESLSKALKTGFTIPISLLEVNRLGTRNGGYVCYFTNFPQYAGRMHILHGHACCIVYPKPLDMGNHLDSIMDQVSNLLAE